MENANVYLRAIIETAKNQICREGTETEAWVEGAKDLILRIFDVRQKAMESDLALAVEVLRSVGYDGTWCD